jgi:hypothetical protein
VTKYPDHSAEESNREEERRALRREWMRINAKSPADDGDDETSQDDNLFDEGYSTLSVPKVCVIPPPFNIHETY